MVFTKPGNIIAENNTSLDQREKSEQQSLAETLRTIDLKFSIDFLEKSQNNQKSLINTLKNGLGSEPLLSYKEQQLTQLKDEIDFVWIEEWSIARTPENVAMLQLFLFLKGAYQPDTNGEVSEKKIDETLKIIIQNLYKSSVLFKNRKIRLKLPTLPQFLIL